MGAFIYGGFLTMEIRYTEDVAHHLLYRFPAVLWDYGRIFTSVIPGAGDTLIQSMTVFGVTMGALDRSAAFPCGNLWQRH